MQIGTNTILKSCLSVLSDKFALFFIILTALLQYIGSIHAQELPTCFQTTSGNYIIDFQAYQPLSPDEADINLSSQLPCPDPGNPGVEDKVVEGNPEISGNFVEVIRIDFSGDNRCSGVLISRSVVLTAAHCTCGSNYRLKMQIDHKSRTFYNLNIRGAPVRFPGYVCNQPPARQVGRDLAFFRLASPLNINDGVVVVPIQKNTANLTIQIPTIRPMIRVLGDLSLRNLFLVGFGRTETGAVPEIMHSAYVSILFRFCSNGTAFASVCARYREFALGRSDLAAGATPTDSCGGDSGGPVYRMDSPAIYKGNQLIRASQRTLVGIVSRPILGVVHQFPGLCGGGGIYTAIGTKPVKDWLDRNDVAINLSYKLRG